VSAVIGANLHLMIPPNNGQPIDKIELPLLMPGESAFLKIY
jgi:hypothetical protein